MLASVFVMLVLELILILCRHQYLWGIIRLVVGDGHHSGCPQMILGVIVRQQVSIAPGRVVYGVALYGVEICVVANEQTKPHV